MKLRSRSPPGVSAGTEDELRIIIDLIAVLTALAELLIKLYDRWKRHKEDKPP
jgi:hypothetical protein